MLAAGSPRYADRSRGSITAASAAGPGFRNGNSYYGIEMPLGMPCTAAAVLLRITRFCGHRPARASWTGYADYWELNRRHVQINRAHCVANPHSHKGMVSFAGDSRPVMIRTAIPRMHQTTTTAPSHRTAALASLPYAPDQVLQVLRHFLTAHGKKLWRRIRLRRCVLRRPQLVRGLVHRHRPGAHRCHDGKSSLAACGRDLFMSAPEVRTGLRRLGFTSPWLTTAWLSGVA